MCDSINTLDKPVESSMDAISLHSFIGQSSIVETLKVGVASAKIRKEQLGHVLLTGPRGSGKSTLAKAIANDLSVGLRAISVRAIKSESDFAAILTNIEPGDVLLCENINSIRQDCVELLCTAMEDFCLDIVIGKGPGARSIRLDLPPFTLVATIDEKIELPDKLKCCFTYNAVMASYSTDELIELARNCANNLEIKISEQGANALAMSANGDYRKLFNAVKRARDFAIVKGNGEITESIVNETISCIIDN